MTFKRAERIIDNLPAGLERGELQKLLTLVARVVEHAHLKDMVRVQWEMENIREVATGYAHCQRLQQDKKSPR